MAASQARFLQLTARRTNIEYMGQQINQQRLALANASAGLFEKMLSTVPPTPPSSQDDKYYKQGYNFIDPADGIQKKLSYKTFIHGAANDFENGIIHDAAHYFLDITPASGPPTVSYTCSQMADGCLDINDPATQAAIAALGIDTSKNSMGYTQAVRLVKVESQVYNPDGSFETVTRYDPAILEFDNLNRLLNVTYLNKNTIDMRPTAADADKPETIGRGDELTYSGIFDDQAYADDMNKYEFLKATYDYQIERINQETRIIQTQDKSLELKMKQLDTEHNAVQTEMEAVQKVLQKNIEGSFKTFA